MPVTPITVVRAGEVAGAGSYAEFELDAALNPGVYVPLCFDDIPEVMVESELVETTQVCSLVKTYIDGVSDTPEITLVTNDDTSNTDLAALAALALSRDTVLTRFVYANGATASFALKLLGYGRNSASGSEAIKVAFKGKVSGDVTNGTVV